MTPDIPKDTLLRARMGDREAFRSVLESVQKLAFNIAYRLTWNASDAEDATQEVFLRLFRNFPQFDPELPFLPWFRRLATNCVLNWKEKKRPTSELPEQIARAHERRAALQSRQITVAAINVGEALQAIRGGTPKLSG